MSCHDGNDGVDDSNVDIIWMILPTISPLLLQYYREAHLELLRKLVPTSSRRSNPSQPFTESTNLSIPLKKKLSKPETAEQSDLSEPSNKPNIIALKDSFKEKSEKISGPQEEGKISTLNQPHTDLPQSKTTFEELNASEWDKSDSKQHLKCQQPIHLSASLQVAQFPAFTCLH